MNNFARAHNAYLEPPDDDPVCEDGCGETLKRDINGEWWCVNKYCPLKFEEGSVEREMAELLIGAQETVKILAWRIKTNPIQGVNDVST